MRVAVAGLRAHTHLPRPIVEPEISSALPLRVAQEAAEVHRAADAAKNHELLGREQDRLDVDFTAFDAVLPIVNRAEGCIDRMLTVQQQPTREIALNHGGVAIRNVVASRDVEMRTRPNCEIEAAMTAPKIQARKAPTARLERTLEALTDPQFVACRAGEKPDVRGDTMITRYVGF